MLLFSVFHRDEILDGHFRGAEGLFNRGERQVLESALKNPLDFVKKGIYNYGQNDLLGESS